MAPNGKVGFHENVGSELENTYEKLFLMEKSQQEDRCAIILLQAVWPEVGCEVEF